ncbi:MAG: ATP-binding protein, partial [Deltaproteobacteria bacterium]|nr:ATP-binding protein [Deltaproteobacteria bacterium]
MDDRPKAILSWSSGKDSAWSLHVLRTRREVEVAGLLTTVNEVHSRVAMHAVRVELLEAQAQAAGLPLWKIPIPSPCSNAETGVAPIFPIWAMPTRELAYEMVKSGLRARVTCVDPKQLPESFAGREFDARFLADLPSDVDPCGERGEFHTFA